MKYMSFATGWKCISFQISYFFTKILKKKKKNEKQIVNYLQGIDRLPISYHLYMALFIIAYTSSDDDDDDDNSITIIWI